MTGLDPNNRKQLHKAEKHYWGLVHKEVDRIMKKRIKAYRARIQDNRMERALIMHYEPRMIAENILEQPR